MNWMQKVKNSQSQKTAMVEYPVAGSVISGLRVSEDIDNISSINASFYQYEILPDIREDPMSDFGSPEPRSNFYARTDIERCYSLAGEIKESGEIMPLIVIIDNSGKGPYILEGGHRFVALHLLGISTFPALVVIDKDKDENE